MIYATFGMTMYVLFVGVLGNIFRDFFITDTKFVLSYWIFLIPISVGVIFLLRKYFLWLDNQSKKTIRIIFVVVTLLFAAISLYVVSSFTISLVRDPLRIVNGAMEWAQHGKFITGGTYFDRAANNFGIVYAMGWWFRWLAPTGLSVWWMLKLLMLAEVFLSIRALIETIRTIFKNLQITTFAMSVIAIFPVYTWYFLLVPYSDQFALLGYSVVLLSIAKVYSKSKLSVVWVVVATLISLLTVLVKANFLIIIPVVVIWGVYLLLNKRLTVWMTILILTVSMSSLWAGVKGNQYLTNQLKYKINPEFEFPLQHWIMMGLNRGTQGTYSDNDVNISSAAGVDKETRRTFDDLVISNRLSKMGITGYFELATTKLINLQTIGKQPKNYFDEFVQAPKWYLKNVNLSRETISILQRAFYIAAALFGNFYIFSIFKHKTNANDDLFFLSALTVDGLLVFHSLLWESNNRYGSAIMPAVIILAIAGIVESSVWEPKFLSNKKLIWAVTGFSLVALLLLPEATKTLPIKNRVENVTKKLADAYDPNKLHQTDTTVTSNYYTGQYGRWEKGFGYPYSLLAKGGQFSQTIKLTVPATHLYLRLNLTRGKSVHLYRLKNHKYVEVDSANYKSQSDFDIDGQMSLSGNFKPGTYKLVIHNDSNHAKQMMLQGSPIMNNSNYLGKSHIEMTKDLEVPYSGYSYSIGYVWGK
ncbi:MAG: hypothetical protein LBM27_00345 [Lactobacillaceae bacterium]|jgi:hypothetical protein|nr:hypothetical protein [Lactobacillaceae bacterium]